MRVEITPKVDELLFKSGNFFYELD